MKSRKTLLFMALAAGLLALLQVQCLLVPDDTEKGQQIANIRPQVRITGGALDTTSAGIDYKVQFEWSGSDQDGVVILFQWAVDDTVSEGAWRDTTGFSALFKFSATTGGLGGDPDVFSDWHTFYLRAIDNEYAVSPAVKAYFNARTIAPSTRITFPNLSTQQIPTMQPTFQVQWTGQDMDSSRPDQKPVYYEYKLVHAPVLHPEYAPDSLLKADNIVLPINYRGSPRDWVRVPNTVTQVTLSLLCGDEAAFAVRSVDEAGAVEPELTLNKNFVLFTVGCTPSKPAVTVCEESMGCHVFPTDSGDTWTGPSGGVEVAAGRPLRFKWTGDASTYGSFPGNVNYALDPVDPEDETRTDPMGIGGWVGWGKWSGNQTPFVFKNDQAGIHTLYVLMRDISEDPASTQRCVIDMNVITYTFGRLALVVDDEVNDRVPDAIHTGFMRRTLLAHLYDFPALGAPTWWKAYKVIGGQEVGGPSAIDLQTLADYQNVIWYVNSNYVSGDGVLTSLRFSEGYGNDQGKRLLTSYVTAGGRLFLIGEDLAGFLTGDVKYPKTPPKPGDQTYNNWTSSFFFKFLYLRNTLVSADQQNSLANDKTCAGQASGLIGARSLRPSFPDLALDRNKQNPGALDPGNKDRYIGGSIFWEGAKAAPTELVDDLPGLDSLYAAETWNRYHASSNNQCVQGTEPLGTYISPGAGAVIAQRYQSTRADTLAGIQHGRTMFFDFEPYWFQEMGLFDAGTTAINWLITGRDR